MTETVLSWQQLQCI